MTTDCYVVQPLLSALAIIDPYPWKHHVECVLVAEWGKALPEVRAQAEATCRTAQARRRPHCRKAVLEAERGRSLALRAHYFDAVFRAGAPNRTPFDAATSLLLPIESYDVFDLGNGSMEAGDEPAADTECDLRLYGVDVVGQINMRAAPSYPPLKDWANRFRQLLIDVVDADRLLRQTATELGRSYNDVLRSIYPSARTVFPKLTYSSRPPVGRIGLRGALHPADQDMIRATFDRAAAGMGLPEAQHPLAMPELTYQTNTEE